MTETSHARYARYKALFIMPAVGISLLVLVAGLVMAFVDYQQRIAWLGAALAALPLPLTVGRIMWLKVARTSDTLPILMFVAAMGVMAAVWETFIEETAGWLPLSAALLAGTLFALYTYWYSVFGRYDSPVLAVGNKLPEFELRDYAGKMFRSTDLLGNPAVVLFYRGNWCPLCMAQISEIAARYREFTDLGITVVMISPQPEVQTRMLAERFDVSFDFLVDSDNQLAGKLAIAQPNGVPVGIARDFSSDTVLPTLVVTGPSGTIVFSDQTDNYRVRPEPDIFLAILRRTGLVAR